jgi:hypothetical protein
MLSQVERLWNVNGRMNVYKEVALVVLSQHLDLFVVYLTTPFSGSDYVASNEGVTNE